MSENPQALSSWSDFLEDATLFDNAVRLRSLIWTIRRYAQAGARLMEVGCGSGTTAVMLADLGYRVTAIDCEAALVARIAERYSDWIRSGRLEMQVADMFSLPWREREYDLAYHQGVLEHFSDDRIVQALSEQRRVAKRLIFDVPNSRYGAHPYGDERLMKPSHWRRLIERSGWTVVQELGRDFDPWLCILPYLFFSRTALERLPWFGRRFAVSSIFVCESVER